MKASRVSFLVAVAVAAVVATALMWPRLRAVERTPPDPPAPEPPADERAAAPAPSAAPAASEPAPEPPLPDHAQLDPRSRKLCPAQMVYVEGTYCPYVAHRCEAYLGVEGLSQEERCERYRDFLICDGRPADLAFCIDRYEYPNLRGVRPATRVSYREAKRACGLEGKRLCEAEEWIFACEGKRTWPYPNGLKRDPSACNIDRVPLRPSEEALSRSFDVSVEVARLDQRVPSGDSPRCASPFAVHDTIGNVSEWVHNREGEAHEIPLVTALAGGHWERAVATCRSLDGTHGAGYRDHRTGFRCCADALDGREARRLRPKGWRLRRRRPLLP